MFVTLFINAVSTTQVTWHQKGQENDRAWWVPKKTEADSHTLRPLPGCAEEKHGNSSEQAVTQTIFEPSTIAACRIRATESFICDLAVEHSPYFVQPITFIWCEMWGSYGSEESRGCDTVYCYGRLPTFRTTLLPQSSGCLLRMTEERNEKPSLYSRGFELRSSILWSRATPMFGGIEYAQGAYSSSSDIKTFTFINATSQIMKRTAHRNDNKITDR